MPRFLGQCHLYVTPSVNKYIVHCLDLSAFKIQICMFVTREYTCKSGSLNKQMRTSKGYREYETQEENGLELKKNPAEAS